MNFLWCVNCILIKHLKKKYEFYPEVGWDPLKDFQQGGDTDLFLEDHSGCSEESGLEGLRREAGIPLRGC